MRALRPLVVELRTPAGLRYLGREGWTDDPRRALPLPPWWARRYEAWLALRGWAARTRQMPRRA
jgi:hypothetical protein